MNPMVVRFGKFVLGVISFYIALLIGVVPALHHGDYLMAAVGIAVTLVLFIVVPVMTAVVMAIREARRCRPPISSKS